ncbi:hypothetical protein [Deinococcus arcticus]|uniref:Uncharacterized protein n=1 Tax=Deinococcus arcticus TaxID=2136176 RepID=A0A2T3WB28_9DEIO|nr:hypothetical protein [Deinococcus arcticus]PTA69047.1 hypothetical protein C8263_04445 [Deinococcus arcticus]
MTVLIASADLRPEHLPDRVEDWRAFASTFEGYLHWNSAVRCGEIANSTRMQDMQTGTLPTDLDVLRTCLFFERRRERHSGSPPDEADLTYFRSILEAIRKQVTARG